MSLKVRAPLQSDENTPPHPSISKAMEDGIRDAQKPPSSQEGTRLESVARRALHRLGEAQAPGEAQESPRRAQLATRLTRIELSGSNRRLSRFNSRLYDCLLLNETDRLIEFYANECVKKVSDAVDKNSSLFQTPESLAPLECMLSAS